MSLEIGSQLGIYSVVGPLGKGGMGEVYRATDTTLDREVAIKVLPDAMAYDRERIARFEREAKVLASLNHPMIAAIYGFHEAEGKRFLVLELVEGPTLADRLAAGRLPVEESLDIAKQIAEALEVAHEKGIIHRDLKPANVKVTPDGQVKVLDFGLAKALTEEDTSVDPGASPTITKDFTMPGVILGTAAYMSPEQARGRPVDKRSDVWSFGCVLYECLSGDSMFRGETVTDSIGAVLHKQPDWKRLPPETPLTVQLLLRKCLAKDRKRRLPDIASARIDLEEAIADPSSSSILQLSGAALAERTRGKGIPLAWAAGAALAMLLVGVAATWFLKPLPPMPEPPAAEPLPVRQISMDLETKNALDLDYGTAIQISPDETMLAFVSFSEATGQRMLMIRRLDELEATPLPGTEDVTSFCFSPDSRWICFGAKRNLKKISVTGGAPLPLCESRATRGISWVEEDWIVFAANFGNGLSRVSAASKGAPEAFTTLAEGEDTHRWPQVLPEGKGVLFTSSPSDRNFEIGNVMVQSVATGEPKVLWPGGYHGRYLASGHLVFISQNTLFAVPFNLDTLTLEGTPFPVLEEVNTNDKGGGHFDVSPKGTLVYQREGVKADPTYELEWVDREGKRELFLPADRYDDLRFSPDGKFLAYTSHDGTQSDIWTCAIDEEGRAKNQAKLTFDSKNDRNPVWSPSSKSIVFSSNRHGDDHLYYRAADGSGEVKWLIESQSRQVPWSWSPDGKHLAIIEFTSKGLTDLRIVPMEGNDETGWSAGEAWDFVATEFIEWGPAFSPDGRWLAYSSGELEKSGLYVREFPGGGSLSQIPSDGRTSGIPVWSVTGSELLFSTDLQGAEGKQQNVFIANYQDQGHTLLTETPVPWTGGTLSSGRGFDLHPDGKRLLVKKAVENELDKWQKSDHVVLVDNFFEFLRQKMPTGRVAKP